MDLQRRLIIKREELMIGSKRAPEKGVQKNSPPFIKCRKSAPSSISICRKKQKTALFLRIPGSILISWFKAYGNVRANSLSQMLKENPELKAVRYSMLPYKEQGQMTNVGSWIDNGKTAEFRLFERLNMAKEMEFFSFRHTILHGDYPQVLRHEYSARISERLIFLSSSQKISFCFSISFSKPPELACTPCTSLEKVFDFFWEVGIR